MNIVNRCRITRFGLLSRSFDVFHAPVVASTSWKRSLWICDRCSLLQKRVSSKSVSPLIARRFSVSSLLDGNPGGRRKQKCNTAATGASEESYSESDVTTDSLDQVEREFKELKLEMFESLIKTESDRESIELVLETYEYAKYTTGCVPSSIGMDEMKQLMSTPRKKITSLLLHLCNRELGRIKYNMLYEQHRKMIAEKRESLYKEGDPRVGIHYDEETGAPKYSLWRNSLFVRLDSQICSKAHDHKLLDAACFGQPLVYDFAFENQMSDEQICKVVNQLSTIHAFNKRAKYPFQLYFCNYNRGGPIDQKLSKTFPLLFQSNAFVVITDKSYLDLFPPENLAYLTKDSRFDLVEFSHDEVYIIGALDETRGGDKKLTTLPKALKEQLKTYRLPLDRHVFMRGTKDLNVRSMGKIMNIVKDTDGDWKEAFTVLPPALVKPPEMVQEEQAFRQQKLLKRRKNFLKLASSGRRSLYDEL